MTVTPPAAGSLSATDSPTLGRAAFKCVNARDFAGARAILERALSLHPKDVMLTHVWAHMADGSGELASGAAELRDLLNGADTTHGLHAHTCWHLADMELDLGHPAPAFDLYERHVADYVPDRPIMFYSAVSLLWRLELMGFGRDAGRQLPWSHLRAARDHILSLPNTPGAMANPPALDHVAHAVTLLTTGATDALTALLSQLPSEDLYVDIVIPTIRGLEAHWLRDHDTALTLLTPLIPVSGRLAKTDAPLPLLEQTLRAIGRGQLAS